jgi:hypothetical protein
VTQPTSTADTQALIEHACRRITAMWPAMHQTGTTGSFAARTPAKALYSHDDNADSDDDLPRLDVLIHERAEAAAKLNGWARIVVEERHLTHALPDGRDAAGLAQLIERHAQWWSGHPASRDLISELRDVAHALTRAVFPNRSNLVRIGPCTNCGEPVRAKPRATWVRCTACGCEGGVGEWIDALSDDELLTPTTTTGLVRILRDRLGMRVTDRTLRRWAVDGMIRPIEAFGPQPQHPRYDPIIVLRDLTRLHRPCAMCGRPWSGEHDVCFTCRPHLATAPTKAARRPAPVATVCAVVAAPVVLTDEQEATLRQARCQETGLPMAWCACGTHERMTS